MYQTHFCLFCFSLVIQPNSDVERSTDYQEWRLDETDDESSKSGSTTIAENRKGFTGDGRGYEEG